MKVLVTGGLGFIGSHTVVELIEKGNEVIIIDNLFNSDISVKDKLEKITGKTIKVYIDDLLDKKAIEKIFDENPDIEEVIHFAGYKAVGESVIKPLEYYHNNIGSTINLLEVMKEHNIKKFIFSSSATIYGNPTEPKFVETMGRGKTTNPYGTTKAMIEKILEDLYTSDNTWSITILRYFNPIGAHSSCLLGEKPNGIPNNLMPYIMMVASGELDHLNVFGNDYETRDGTGERDFIHVVDLAKGHVAAMDGMEKYGTGIYYYNLGTGHGATVLELVNTFEKVNNIKIKYEISERRPGDIAISIADASLAYEKLGWKTEKTLEDMCKDSWNFKKKEMEG